VELQLESNGACVVETVPLKAKLRNENRLPEVEESKLIVVEPPEPGMLTSPSCGSYATDGEPLMYGPALMNEVAGNVVSDFRKGSSALFSASRNSITPFFGDDNVDTLAIVKELPEIGVQPVTV